MPKNRNKVRNDVIKDIRLLLGDGMIDMELDPEHYDVALDVAISKIRQRSDNSVEEDFYAIELKADIHFQKKLWKLNRFGIVHSVMVYLVGLTWIHLN